MLADTESKEQVIYNKEIELRNSVQVSLASVLHLDLTGSASFSVDVGGKVCCVPGKQVCPSDFTAV